MKERTPHDRRPATPAAPAPAFPFHAWKLGQDGPWTVYKCFYQEPGEEGEDAEFFLTIDEQTGAAALRPKDSAYADTLTRAFGQAMRAEPAHAERGQVGSAEGQAQRA